MGASALTDHAANGGFPKPGPGLALRVFKARHESCGTETRIQIPAALSARAVRMVHCRQCGERFEVDSVTEAPAWRLPSLSLPRIDPSSRAWQLASVPVAALLVIGGLFLIQGGDGGAETSAPSTAIEQPAATTAGPEAPLSKIPGEPSGGGNAAAEIVRGSHYSLALPTGWQKVDPPSGATFSAVGANGEAEATLWISEDANLDFPAFVTQSLNQLETLAPNPRVVSRVPGPTPETTIVRLAADTPADQASYEVLLRAAGPYRYYLALTVQPDAAREATDGIELIAGSMTPEVNG